MQIPAVEGLAHFTRMARLCEMPVLAAGGVPVESASSFRASGAAGILIDDDVRDALDPAYRVTQWSRLPG
ncbi:MAG: hypothetical protein U1F77_12100 [Kiritimatiellia bacterium]